MLHQLAIDGSQVSRDMDSGMASELVAPLSSGIAFGVPERDVELVTVNAESSESDTSHIRIVSQPCKGRLLFYLSL